MIAELGSFPYQLEAKERLQVCDVMSSYLGYNPGALRGDFKHLLNICVHSFLNNWSWRQLNLVITAA